MKPSGIAIRPVDRADLSQLLRLCRAHAAYEQAEWIEAGQVGRWQDAFFATEPRLYGWVADRDGVLVGFMTVTIDYATWSASRFAHMDCLFIDADYRGAGLGRQFIACLAGFCRAHALDHAQWQTPPGNASGIAFYRRAGARAKDKLRFFLDCPPTAITPPEEELRHAD